MRPEIYVLRHGQTEWNRDGLMQGHGNSPLTALGRKQAARQGEILRGLDLPRGVEAWSSPSGRAIETAGIAVAPLVRHVRTDDRLMEIGVGRGEGTSGAGLVELREAEGFGAWLDALGSMDGAEARGAFEARIRDFLDCLRAPAIVVCHGGTRLVLRAIHAGRDIDDLPEPGASQGSVLHLSAKGERWLT